MKFSVIIPVYNFEKYIEKCIDSVLAQSYEDFELVIVDDGSDDNTPAICDRYADSDKRVKVIHQKNRGVVNARKNGIFASKGDYIVYVDADDWIEKNLLDEVAAVEEKYPDVDIIIYDAIKLMESGNSYTESTISEGYYDKSRMIEEVYPGLIQDRKKGLGDGNIEPLPWNKAYRREILKEHYCRDERITVLEDSAFCYECILAAEDIYILKKVLYNYNRFNPESAMRRYNPKLMQSSSYEVLYLKERLKPYPYIRSQLVCHIAARIVYCIGHEVKNNSIKVAEGNIKNSLKDTGMLRLIRIADLKELPPIVMVYICILKLHMYRIALIIAKKRLK